PLWMIKKGISLVNKEGKPAIIYLHPREIDPLAPKLDLPFREKAIHYWGIGNTKKKLIALLKGFSFGSIRDNFFSDHLS
ncbi:MAG: DUF3473 domain-containing protein, partial [Candidatus Pacebacteria bacterium]|nr:DUF3473 domain-containing protein [Candidatus Paceibacterota bacterium]